MLLIIALSGKQYPIRKVWEGLEGSGDPGREVWVEIKRVPISLQFRNSSLKIRAEQWRR